MLLALASTNEGATGWPRVEATLPALRAMLIYNFLATTYLVDLRFGRELIGRLLLPAIAVHAMLTLPLIGAWFRYKSAEASKE